MLGENLATHCGPVSFQVQLVTCKCKYAEEMRLRWKRKHARSGMPTPTRFAECRLHTIRNAKRPTKKGGAARKERNRTSLRLPPSQRFRVLS